MQVACCYWSNEISPAMHARREQVLSDHSGNGFIHKQEVIQLRATTKPILADKTKKPSQTSRAKGVSSHSEEQILPLFLHVSSTQFDGLRSFKTWRVA